ncbi:MAG TPA: hypothetical protein VLH35_05665 [Candidatus Acidoferrales bacterium]|nr:hypothetical protein [Candidatus Acidoferrales bacterium]
MGVIRLRYPDLDKRAQELKRISEIFELHELYETASRIIAFETLLDDSITPKTKTTEFLDLIRLCEFEFGNQDVCGEFRRACFNQIGHLILDASVTSGADVRATLNEFKPMLDQITNGKKILGELSDFARNNTVDDTILFHLSCYSYVVIVEATFDELARILFYLHTLTNGKTLTLEELQKLEVNQIYKKLEPKPIFLHNWNEKKHIRNAISHATAYYKNSDKSIRFIDNAVEPFDKTMSMSEFGKKLLELTSVIDAFIFFNLLLKVNDMLICPNIFE